MLGADVPGLAVSLREVERLAGKVRAQNRSAKEILGLTNDRLLIVLGFETDLFLEQAWQPERRRAILTAIQAVRPDLAVAWGYSVWHQHSGGWAYPRITQLHNMKRSLRIYEDLRRFDLPSIPHVYWGDTDDILRWARWLSSTPAISAIAIDLQTADSSVNWALALRGLATIRQAVPKDICLLVNGPCSAARVRAIDNVWPGCTLTNFGAYFSALYPRKPMYGLRAAWAGKLSLTPKAVFCHVVEEYLALLGDRSRVIQPPSWDDWAVPTRGLGTEPVNERCVLRNGGQLRLPLPTASATTTVGRN